MLRWTCIVITCASCGKKSPLDELATRPRKTIAGDTCIPPSPEAPRRGTPCVNTRFSVDLPDGLERNRIDSLVGIGGDYGQAGENEPGVSIERCQVPSSRDAWKKRYSRWIDEDIDLDEQLADGFLVASHHIDSSHNASVVAVHVKGDVALCCHAAFIDNDHRVGDAARRMLQEICRSVAFR
jgi:hypothetical protein